MLGIIVRGIRGRKDGRSVTKGLGPPRGTNQNRGVAFPYPRIISPVRPKRLRRMMCADQARQVNPCAYIYISQNDNSVYIYYRIISAHVATVYPPDYICGPSAGKEVNPCVYNTMLTDVLIYLADYIRPCGHSVSGRLYCDPSARREVTPCVYIYISQNVNILADYGLYPLMSPKGLWQIICAVQAHAEK